MPFKSKSQQRLFYAAASKKGGIGDLSQAVAKKFIEDSKGEPSPKKEKVGFKRLSKYIKGK